MKRQRSSFVVALCLSLFAARVDAASIALAWNASTNATGYIVFYGTTSGTYTSQTDVGAATQATISGLADGTTYYFAVKAYNASGQQSGFSAEVSGMTAPSVINPAPSVGFGGNSRTSLLLQSGTGMLQAWMLNGVFATGLNFTPAAILDPNWKIVGSADFNNDSYPDLLLQHAVTGGLYLWYMRGSSLLSPTWLSPSGPTDPDWKVVGIADFNGDGRPDVVFQHRLTGALVVWYMNGTDLYRGSSFSPAGPTDPAWKVVATADFDKDGKPDLLFQNQTTGVLVLWKMNGVQLVSSSVFSPAGPLDPAWKVVGTADLNNDGYPDLVLQHQTSGLLFAWYLSGTTATGGSLFTPAGPSDPSWKVVTVH